MNLYQSNLIILIFIKYGACLSYLIGLKKNFINLMIMNKIKKIIKKFIFYLLIYIFKLKFFTNCKFKKNIKSIVLVIHSFQIGGAEKQWIYLANSLSKKFDVTLVSLESKDTHYKYLLNSNIKYFSIDIIDNPDLKIPFLLRI